MKNTLIAGIALMMLAGTVPATAYHTAHLAASNAANTYTVGLTDLEVLCESYGLADAVNSAPVSHGGVSGLCYMSSNDGTCTTNTLTIENPFKKDNCSVAERPTGAFTTFNLLQFPFLPDYTGTRTGSVFFIANVGGVGGLFAGAGADGACVEDHYSDVSGASGGHVAASDPILVVFLGVVGSVPVVDLNSLPGDQGTYSTFAGACAKSLTDDVGSLGVFFVNPIANSALYIF